MDWIKNLAEKAKSFFQSELWIRNAEASSHPVKRVVRRSVRIVFLALKGFRDDQCALHSAALTFSVVMALVPLVAVVFALSNALGFGADEGTHYLLQVSQNMPEQFNALLQKVITLANATNFSALGGAGAAVLLLLVIKMLSRIEESFNKIWNVTSSRNFLRKAQNYITILVVTPLLIALATTGVAVIEGFSEEIMLLGPLVKIMIRISPIFIICLAFWFIYIFLPNTDVNPKAAILSALISAILWVLWQFVFMRFQVGIARYNAIYGTIALIPIFLFWMNLSWMILLLGVELTFAIQNVETYTAERLTSKASPRLRIALSLALMRDVLDGFDGKSELFNTREYARRHQISLRLIERMTAGLVRAGFITSSAEYPHSYVLVHDPQNLGLKQIYDAIMNEGVSAQTLGLHDLPACTDRVWGATEKALSQSLGTLNIRDLSRSD